MKRKNKINFLVVTIYIIFTTTAIAAGNVDILKGKVYGAGAQSALSVFLLDKDGSILDISTPDTKGNFSIDVTIMDEPSYQELMKLKLRIANKKGMKKDYIISERVEQYVDTEVVIEPLRFVTTR